MTEEQDAITITKEAVLKQLERLLTDLNLIQEGLIVNQEQIKNLNARVTELSERFNRFLEYLEELR